MPPAPPPSALDANQVLQHAFEDATGRLRVDAEVTATIGDLELDISHTDDSIRLGDGTSLVTATTIGPDVGLDVNIINTSLPFSATDLDIRDLVFATDKVDVSGSEVSLDAGTLAALGNITVSSVDLDIRDLVFATDKVDVSGSEISLDAGTLAALENITVTAIDLDIRDLTSLSDSVQAWMYDGSGNAISSTAGAIDVNITSNLDALTPPTKSDPDNVLIVGTENGEIDGNKLPFINNIRLQILASHDREQDITYADFGTKNERITQIDYTSPTFPGTTARKTITYTLIVNKYRTDSIIWSLI